MTEENQSEATGLNPKYKGYDLQKCFIAYTEQAPWSVDLLSACQQVLSQPDFNLEPDYARKHFDPDITLRDKALELIANARYGIYDLSHWQDKNDSWQIPRNVFIEFGMAILLNRPTLLLRYAGNQELEMPECLKGIGRIVEFGGQATLARALKKHLPEWIDVLPDRDWWNRYCIFGNRTCEYREIHPRNKQWGQKTLRCHIADGDDVDRDDFRSVAAEILGSFSDVAPDYLDAIPKATGYDFLLCTHCQIVRSTPFAIYRITPRTPVEAYISIGMSIALESQYEYNIPKILLANDVQDVPSLLSGYEVVAAKNDKAKKDLLRRFLPKVMHKVRKASWKPRPLPFCEIVPQISTRDILELGLTWPEVSRLGIRHTKSQLTTFDATTYIDFHQEIEADLRQSILDAQSSFLVVTGHAGAGKTSLVYQVADSLVSEANLVVFLYSAARIGDNPWGAERVSATADNIKASLDNSLENALLETIAKKETNLESVFRSLDTQWRKQNRRWRFLLMIDAIDEHSQVSSFIQQIGNIWSIAGQHPWFNLVLSARSAAWDTLSTQSRLLAQIERGKYVVFELKSSAQKESLRTREGRVLGTVKWFNDSRGYGFIVTDSEDDIFVHFSAIKSEGFRTLRVGQRVEFSIEQGARGRQAADVKVLM